jgi:hypothetical protein
MMNTNVGTPRSPLALLWVISVPIRLLQQGRDTTLCYDLLKKKITRRDRERARARVGQRGRERVRECVCV